MPYARTAKSIFMVLYFASRFDKVLRSVAPVHSCFRSSSSHHLKRNCLLLLSARFHISKPNTATGQHFQRDQVYTLFSIRLPFLIIHFCLQTWVKSFNILIIYNVRNQNSIQNKTLFTFLGF